MNKNEYLFMNKKYIYVYKYIYYMRLWSRTVKYATNVLRI